MNIMQSFRMPGDDEFEDEPEDELAAVGMHVVEAGEEDDDDEKKPEDLEGIEEEETKDEEEEKKEESDEPPSGLKELEQMEKEYLNTPLTIDNYDE